MKCYHAKLAPLIQESDSLILHHLYRGSSVDLSAITKPDGGRWFEPIPPDQLYDATSRLTRMPLLLPVDVELSVVLDPLTLVADRR